MKVFDNLRKRIVQKLIQPEDGYIYTGLAAEGQPIKFYYNKERSKYLLGMRTKDEDYFIPTLTGWVDGRAYSDEIREVDFKFWIHGVLDNVCDQYFDRLNNLSARQLKSIRDYNKQGSGEKLVITKKSFCDIMDALDNYWNNLRVLEDVLNVYFESGMLSDIFDKVIEALEEEMEPDLDWYEEPIIMHWLIGLDAGRAKEAAEGIEGHSLASAEELYDYLKWKQEDRVRRDAIMETIEVADVNIEANCLGLS